MTYLEKLAEIDNRPLTTAREYCPHSSEFKLTDRRPDFCYYYDADPSAAEFERVCIKCWLREYKEGNE